MTFFSITATSQLGSLSEKVIIRSGKKHWQQKEGFILHSLCNFHLSGTS